MRLLSVNVGLPRDVTYKNKRVTTGIYKTPTDGRVTLRRLNLDGDRQADPTVHGGPSKAVYAYPSEHYDYWRPEFPGMTLPWGMFGENFTVEGMREDGVHIGDRFRIGSAEVAVTEPRLPCFKLASRFGRDDIIKRFLASGRTGFYFAVLQEGEVGAGDPIELVVRDANEIAVADITRLYVRRDTDLETMRRAIRVSALPESWRGYFRKRIERARAAPGSST
jgi:MOSC domain-containing protein YiiM